MEQHKARMKQEQQIQIDIIDLEGQIFEARQKTFKTEELLWEKQSMLHILQRARIKAFKQLSENERLALRSGLSVAEIVLGKKLLKEAVTRNKEFDKKIHGGGV